MISLTGILSLPLLMAYSMMLHTRKIRSDGSNRETVVKMVLGWWVLCIAPVAITFQSTLMGYVCYMILFGIIFMTLQPLWRGRGPEWELEILAISASIIVFSAVIAGFCGLKQSIMQPFSSAIQVLGCNTIYCSMLFFTFEGYIEERFR